ncbi:MAG: hypothetical protein F6K42_30630 [Leptolyngbya sp. SIO1D8]|nr:hypothetical protein [Leptolyngbya sp. SIO1D8]
MSRTEPDGTSVAYTYHPSGQMETITASSSVSSIFAI